MPTCTASMQEPRSDPIQRRRRRRRRRRHFHGVSSLPEDLVQEILVRLPPDEPAHLVRASLVCKAWHRVLSDRDCFLRRCRMLHGDDGATTPPVLGYIQNRYYRGSSMEFVPVVPATTTSTASSLVRMPPAADYISWVALDCRHGRVLIHSEDDTPSKWGRGRLIVWDPITGGQQHLSAPSAGYRSYSFHNFTGAVLCPNGNDGPLRVVFVETNLHKPVFACATSYSSLTGAWSAPTPLHVTCNSRDDSRYKGRRKPSLVIGDAVYFLFALATIILKYDLRTHRLSEISMPRPAVADVSKALLMKAEDGGGGGGLGLVTLSGYSILMWSRQDNVATNDMDGWVRHKAVTFGTLLPRHVHCNQSDQVVGFAEGTNTVFVKIYTTIFMIDLKSKRVRKAGEREDYNRLDLILPYMSFFTPSLQDLPKGKLYVTTMKMQSMNLSPSPLP